MNRFAIILLAMLAFTTGCSVKGIAGDGTLKTETRTISAYSAVSASGGYDIKWSVGQPSLTIATDQNLLPHIKTTVVGNVLKIESDASLHATKGILITLSGPSLSQINVAGDIHFAASRITGDSLGIQTAGNSRIEVDGSVKNLAANLVGESKLEAKSLQAQSVSINSVGDSTSEVAAAVSLKVDIAGAATVTYHGSPKIEQHIVGDGKIQAAP